MEYCEHRSKDTSGHQDRSATGRRKEKQLQSALPLPGDLLNVFLENKVLS